MKRDKVIIFGVLRQEDYPLEAPIGDAGWEVWAMNGSWEPERWDRWFQLHGIEHMFEAHNIDYIRWLQTIARYHTSKRVYVWDSEQHHFPGALYFPLAELTDEFGDYFTGSFAYLLALAILRGFKQVYLATGDMSGEKWAIPCIEHYAGIAKARGIEVMADRDSGLFHKRLGGLYGIGRHRGGNFEDEL